MKDYFGTPSNKEIVIVIIGLAMLFVCGAVTALLTAF